MSVKPVQQTEFAATTDKLLALEASARQEFVIANPTLDWARFVSSLTDRVREEVRVDTTRANELADLAITVAETIANKLPLAKSLRAKANALYALDQHTAAIEMHQRAAALFEAEGDEE